MDDYALPPPAPPPARATGGLQRGPHHLPPDPAPQAPPEIGTGDLLSFSRPRGGVKAPSPEIGRASDDFERVASGPRPLPEKLERLTELYRQAVGPQAASGNEHALHQLREAAGETVETLFRNEIKAIEDGRSLSPEQQRQALQDLSKQLETLTWLGSGFKSGLAAELAFAGSR